MGLFTEISVDINVFPTMGLYTGGGGAYTWEKLAMEKMIGLYMGGGGLIFGGLLNGPTDQ